ncbi:hypothetical protein ACIQ9P_05265 [Kitasatospora sp. NPDC094019]|uniref:hypothetical protein n=1 Tax=Kitasatospora sp. NPDC094019 TaxID=3364091 RepID=UPI0038172E00
MPVCSLGWFLAAAPHAPEAAGVLFTSVFQATMGIAALAGGGVVDRTSPGTVLVLAGLTALLAAGTALATSATPPGSATSATSVAAEVAEVAETEEAAEAAPVTATTGR